MVWSAPPCYGVGHPAHRMGVALQVLVLCLCWRTGMAGVCDGVPIAENLTRISHPQMLIGIGPGKSGTTFFFSALRSHPKIRKGWKKEMHSFSGKYKPTQEYYNKYMRSWGTKKEWKGNPVLLEITPAYLQTYEVPCRIRNFVPNAKFLVTLRHPVDRTMSLINMKRGLCIRNPEGKESRLQCCCTDLFYDIAPKIAASIENMRADAQQCLNVSSPDPWRGCSRTKIKQMKGSIYGTPLAHWFKVFDPSQFIFVNANELFKDPATQVNRVLEFLGMSTDWKLDMKNTTKHKARKYYMDSDVHVIKRMLRDSLEDPLQDFYRVLKKHGIKFSPLKMSPRHHSNVPQESVEKARKACRKRKCTHPVNTSDHILLPLSNQSSYAPAPPHPMIGQVSSLLNQSFSTAYKISTPVSIPYSFFVFLLFPIIAFVIWKVKQEDRPIYAKRKG